MKNFTKKCQTIKSQKLWWSGLPETIEGMVAYMVSKNFGGEKNPETIALAGYIKNKICEPTKKKEQQRSPTTFVYKIIFVKLDKI